jgi:AraC-like DNA-binding protein
VDVLADLLARARAEGSVFARTSIAEDVGVEFGGKRRLAIHTILEGTVWFERDGTKPVRLEAGDLIFIPAGPPYRAVGTPGGHVRPHGDPAPPSGATVVGRLLCGAYAMDAVLYESLLAALPQLVPIPRDGAGNQLQMVLAFLTEELSESEPGAQTVLDRSLDLMLALGLRAWFHQPQATLPGWYAALDDPLAGPAVRAMHAEPSRAWTVSELAQLGKSSRAAFAKRFHDVVGQPPMTYLTNWRMTLAAQALANTPMTIAAVADQAGYSNEYAFATAFRRQFGAPPGRWRSAHRAT